jgi:RNA polymerase sigma-70 factor (ECF subfamily)
MIRHSKRRPEAAVSELTDHDGPWLENQLSDLSAERHESSERGRVAADIAEKVLSELSPEDRLVVMSIDGERLPVKDVAEMIGWSESKVKVRAFRARRRMREAVENLLRRTRKTGSEEGKNDE